MKGIVFAFLAFSVLLLGCVAAEPAARTPIVVDVQPASGMPVGPNGDGTPVPEMNVDGEAQPPVASGASVKEFTVSITHERGYVPNRFEVNAGDTVRFTVTSTPLDHRHGMSIDALGVDVEVTRNPQVIEFVAGQPGEFQIYCKSCERGFMGGHPWMTGTLVVR